MDSQLITRTVKQVMRWGLGLFATLHLLFLLFLFVNHLSFPLNLEVMEGTVLLHFERAVALQHIYTAPTPDFVALAYNPLYYFIAVPLSWLFGVNLFTLRLVSVMGTIGSATILYLVVRKKSGSAWWGLLTAGLFAAAYRVMDAYIDTAHSDAMLLFSLLLGSYLIDRKHSAVGILVLVASFWFKQHGALFCAGGVAFLTIVPDDRKATSYWLIAALLGPCLYFLAGPLLFGPEFHYFTLEVPSSWSSFHGGTLRRYFTYILMGYPLLAVGTLLAFLRWRPLSIWHVQGVMALLSGLMGSMDGGSNNNVYIPMGTFLILLGVLGLQTLHSRRGRIEHAALAASFFFFAYEPSSVIMPSEAQKDYDQMVAMLQELDGRVYAPEIGQLQKGYRFYPSAFWVPLLDMVRGDGHQGWEHPKLRKLLRPVLQPTGRAYIWANRPIDEALYQDYILVEDFGERFKSLQGLPHRWGRFGWPRYLYRYDASASSLRKLKPSPHSATNPVTAANDSTALR